MAVRAEIVRKGEEHGRTREDIDRAIREYDGPVATTTVIRCGIARTWPRT